MLTKLFTISAMQKTLQSVIYLNSALIFYLISKWSTTSNKVKWIKQKVHKILFGKRLYEIVITLQECFKIYCQF